MIKKIKKKFNCSKNGQDGQVLIIALIFCAIGSLIIGGLLSYAASALKQGTAIEARDSQLYSADAAVENAIWWLDYADHGADPLPSVVGNYKALPLVHGRGVGNNHKSYITYLGKQNGSDIFQAQSYAGPNILDNSNRDAPQNGPYEMVISNIAYNSGTLSLFNGPNAITVLNGNLNIGNNATVTSTPQSNQGNIVANGNINVGSNSVIDGDATVTGTHTVTLGNNAQVEGTGSAAALSFSPVDTSAYKTQAQVAQNGVLLSAASYSNTNNQTYTINNANTHLTGNLILGNNTSLTVNGNLYIDGFITTGNNSTLKVNGALYVGSYLNTGNNTNLSLGGTTYVNGYLNLNNDSAISGAYTIVAKNNVTFDNNSVVSIPNTPLFISEQGNIQVNNNVNLACYLYAPNGSVTLGNNDSITGAVVGQSVNVDNNASVTFITSGRSGLPGQGSAKSLSVITWDATTH